MIKKYFIITLLIATIFLTACQGDADPELEALAKCLTENGAKFYGAYWCPHCENQKDAFGSAVKYLPYVECTDYQEECAAAGVEGYPTWTFADGSTLVGEQSFGALANAAGCDY